MIISYIIIITIRFSLTENYRTNVSKIPLLQKNHVLLWPCLPEQPCDQRPAEPDTRSYHLEFEPQQSRRPQPQPPLCHHEEWLAPPNYPRRFGKPSQGNQILVFRDQHRLRRHLWTTTPTIILRTTKFLAVEWTMLRPALELVFLNLLDLSGWTTPTSRVTLIKQN